MAMQADMSILLSWQAMNMCVCVRARALSKIHLLKQHYKLTLFCFIVIGKFH